MGECSASRLTICLVWPGSLDRASSWTCHRRGGSGRASTSRASPRTEATRRPGPRVAGRSSRSGLWLAAVFVPCACHHGHHRPVLSQFGPHHCGFDSDLRRSLADPHTALTALLRRQTDNRRRPPLPWRLAYRCCARALGYEYLGPRAQPIRSPCAGPVLGAGLLGALPVRGRLFIGRPVTLILGRRLSGPSTSGSTA